MDDHDDVELEDVELGAALRRRAGQLAGPIDLEAALTNVLDRSRARRRWRVVATTAVAAAAAAIVGILGLVVLGGGERAVLVGPATQPVPPASAPAPSSTPPIVTGPVTTVLPAAPATPPPDSAPASATSVATVPSTTAAPAAPVTTTYTSVGGSISVLLADGRVSLDGDPVPTSGWTMQIDDDGPDRVRVRFERGANRSEIRVDLVNGVLDPRITES